MKNGQLKPGYNIQAATTDQYVVDYAIFPNPTDFKTLEPVFGHLKNVFGMRRTHLRGKRGRNRYWHSLYDGFEQIWAKKMDEGPSFIVKNLKRPKKRSRFLKKKILIVFIHLEVIFSRHF